MASLLEDLHSVAAEPSEQEEFWRREFEYAGYAAVKRIVSGTIGWDEPRRQFALQWLREKESEVVRREKQMQLDATRIEKILSNCNKTLPTCRRTLAACWRAPPACWRTRRKCSATRAKCYGAPSPRS